MKSILVLFGFCISFGAIYSFKLQKNDLETVRIYNGLLAKLGQFPFILRLDGYAICTSTLITTKTALAAAHCVYDEKTNTVDPVSKYYGLLGIVHINQAQKKDRLPFEKFHVHKDYHPDKDGNDIATFILKNPVTNAKTLALPAKGLTFLNAAVTAIGWGVSELGNNDILHYAPGKVSTNKECRDKMRTTMANSDVCMVLDNNRACLEGDSGGPLVTKYKNTEITIGIAAAVAGDEDAERNNPVCSPYTIYTSVSEQIDWIVSHSDGKVVTVK